ncbi:MAG: PqqD family protein [Clostridiaceae bacterium]|nr:PqqD family protein [Clostridiaceae bacterium]MDD6703420.1 PqqD family protein [Clostridiaceae bacterium]MDY5934304.1 PqqD family protein [Oscillospiraceae bacterium]
MKVKDQLVLREIAGQYVIVPVMERVKDVQSMVYISSSAAYLWQYMEGKEFTLDELVDLILAKYKNVTREKAQEDIIAFLQILARNNIMDMSEEQ